MLRRQVRVVADWELAHAAPKLPPKKDGTERSVSMGDTNTLITSATEVSTPISGTDKTLSFETGLLAQRSQGAVVGRIGDTVVLATANASKDVREGIDFFPLTVDVEERMYAAGKIPGIVLPPGGPTDRPGHPDLPADRPAAAPVVCRRLPQRDPGRGHHHRRRPGKSARRAGHQLRQRRPHAVGDPLRRSPRRGPGGLSPPRAPGSRTPPTRTATSRPSSSSWLDASSPTATSPS